MSAGSPSEGLRMLAMLIAADLLSGGSALAEVEICETRTRRGRKPARVVAVAVRCPNARAA